MTAPALPGAAPDPDRLPPEVEKALTVLVRRVAEHRSMDGSDDADFGMVDDARSRVESAKTALRTAIARALGGDGAPVAWGVVDRNRNVVELHYHRHRDVADGAVANFNLAVPGYAPFTVVPLYTRPAATGDTGEGGGALIGEAFDLIGHVVNHARRSTNIDGTRRRLGDDEACGRNWIALVDKCEALLATRAATGGPDAR